ncbi:DUF4136 domain-containing protein [Alteromonas antoniana]|uniref:DUF4136 domain-containing protein n=1 Tax=Alteromonas antoniana TaxID=2803813 RepID=UPI001C45404F|nr:DUF4136 domain-containing protein [Alteromonas antoniana]
MQNIQIRMRNVRFILVALIAALTLAGCASNKPQIKKVENFNFASVNTFFVKPPLNSVNPTIENHLAASITDILTRKGLTPVSKEEADVEVGFFPSTALKENGKSVSIGLGTGVFGRSSGISLGSIFNIPVGEQVTQYQNLQIDIVENGNFIYSAAGSAELETHDSITIQTALTELVNELLEPYPQKLSDSGD